MQHFELMTILPALFVGYVNVAHFLSTVLGTLMHEGRHTIANWA